jgi:hypothetical protein
VLQRGDDQVMALSPDVVARVRRLGDGRAMVVANRGATEVRVPAGLFEGGNWTTSSGQLIEPGQIAEGVAVAPMSAAIYFGKGPVA